MLRVYLSRLLGEHKKKISDVARDTGINRGTLTRMYYEDAERVDLEVLDILCQYFGCSIQDLLEPEQPKAKLS
ncbi:helix-turn-helix transcriptional regulator [Polynucleobacter sp. MWH-Adler-W8]|uniref:helix-turn-helix domain-containing protein n=1 Tax=Polynucleobacter sp. MWH-Adler-W8 TaxID=1819727 RepID=UPI00092A86DA|nr:MULTISPECIES: helix-turn-helix transcriptional regulator [Polynucleobacter]OJI04663.1 transcriptional regulator [Polynucleobacter sp. MWH-Adler-W8]